MRSASALDEALCDNVLCSVLSWLEPRTLRASASVCKRWTQAADCSEVWRRRAEPQLLVLAKQLAKQLAAAPARELLAPPPKGVPATRDKGNLLECERIKPVKLLTAVYCSNLLANGSFLERMNEKGGVWVSRAGALHAPPWHGADQSTRAPATYLPVSLISAAGICLPLFF